MFSLLKSFIVIISIIKKKTYAFVEYSSSSDKLYLFWTTIIYYLLSIFNLNNKTIFLSLLALWFLYNFYLKNVRKALILTAMASLIFIVGKSWKFQLIPQRLLKVSPFTFPEGYIVYFTVTAFQIFTLIILIIIIRDLICKSLYLREKLLILFKQKYFFFIFMFFFWRVFAGFLVKNLYYLPIVYSIQYFSYFIFFASLLIYFSYLKKDKFFLSKAYFSQTTFILGAMTVFEAILSFLQWLGHSTVGFAIESTERFLTYESGIGQGYFSVRPLGTFSHANELSAFGLFSSIFFFVLLYLKKEKIFEKYYFLFFAASLASLILSLGRAAWISFFIMILFFLYIIEKKWHVYLIDLKKIPVKAIVYGLFFLSVVLILSFPRMVRLLDLLKPMGGGRVRIQLMNESLNLIKNKPLLGTGMGLSGLSLFQINPRGAISRLPSVVHNYFLLIPSESGVPDLFFFLFFFLFFLKTAMAGLANLNKDGKIKKLGILLTLFSFFIFGLMHQMFKMDYFLIFASLLLTNENTKN